MKPLKPLTPPLPIYEEQDPDGIDGFWTFPNLDQPEKESPAQKPKPNFQEAT